MDNRWRVRIDLIADDDDGRRVDAIARRIRALGADEAYGGVGIDQGTGVARQPVIGLLFWVSAATVGGAADLAVSTAQRLAAGTVAGPEIYDVVLIPEAAVSAPDDERYPNMPD